MMVLDGLSILSKVCPLWAAGTGSIESKMAPFNGIYGALLSIFFTRQSNVKSVITTRLYTIEVRPIWQVLLLQTKILQKYSCWFSCILQLCTFNCRLLFM